MRLLFSIALAMSVAFAGYADPRLENQLAVGSQSGAGVVALFCSRAKALFLQWVASNPTGGRQSQTTGFCLLR